MTEIPTGGGTAALTEGTSTEGAFAREVRMAEMKIQNALDDLDRYPNPRQNGHVMAKSKLIRGIVQLVDAKIAVALLAHERREHL